MTKKSKGFKFIDLFAGIGGFHLAMHNAGGKCVFASEWDKFARVTYEHNFKKYSPELFSSGNFNSDITQADPDAIADFDVLCAGFPCQAFSHAGLKRGFEDTRGTLFFNVADIISHKKQKGKPPKVVLLENVKGLKSHDKGRTLITILDAMDKLGYYYKTEVLNSKNFGVPQNRERIFIVCWLKTDKDPNTFKFPLGLDNRGHVIYDKEKLIEQIKPTIISSILLPNPDEKYTISDRLFEGHKRRLKEHKEKGNGFGFSLFKPDMPYTSTISARYYKDGSEIMIFQEGKNPRKLTPKEAGKLQGYPIGKEFNIVVSDVQAYKQFGNSVSIPVVKTLAKEILKQLL